MVSLNTDVGVQAKNNLAIANKQVSSSISRLSSGNRITQASDDVAGLAIGTVLRTEVTALKSALINTSQAQSMLGVADGALAQVSDLLNRQKSLSSQANSGSLDNTTRSFLNLEFQTLVSEIDRLSETTNFNNINLIDGSLNAPALTTSTTPTYKDYTAAVAGTASLPANPYSVTATSYYVQGLSNDSIVASVDPSLVAENPNFVGQLSGFQATYSSANKIDLSIQVGDYTYQAGAQTTVAGSSITLTSVQAGGGSFAVVLGAVAPAVTDQTDATNFAARLNSAFEGFDMMQKRTIQSYSGGGMVYPTGSTTATGDLSGSSVQLISDDFTNVQIQDIIVTAPVNSSSSATIEMIVNGESYVSGFKNDGQSVEALSSLTVANVLTGTSVASGNSIGLVNTTDPTKVIVFNYPSTTTGLNLTTNANAQAAENALKSAFGIGTNGVGLSFQVGSSANDTIGVTIGSAKTADLYLDSNGNSQTISIDTQANAAAASSVLDNAVNSLVSLRANVGSIQSRMDYVSASISSSIENQDSARGLFLDTDVAEESTNLAQAQVRLQASVSVLAQANQLSQGLLKLIG